MSRRSSKQLNQLISNPSGEIKSLLDQLAKIEALNNTLQSKLNANFSTHCRVANYRKNILVVAVDSAAWANKLRFQIPELISEFRNDGYFGLANIEIIVSPR